MRSYYTLVKVCGLDHVEYISAETEDFTFEDLLAHVNWRNANSTRCTTHILFYKEAEGGD